MTEFAGFLAEDRRLVILRFLTDVGGHANESVIETALQRFGHRVGVTRDIVREDLRFLTNADCLVTEIVERQIMVATITKRGVSAAQGHIQVEGVKSPSIGI
jgi:hypothetical protein